MTGYIKLHRSLLDWEWYDDHNATRLLVHLNLIVNYAPKKWKGIEIEPGSLVTSFEKLSKETGLTVKQVRVAMKKCEDSREVARKRARKGQLITLLKWEKLQVEDNKGASNKAGKGQEKGKKRATTKECKEGEECKEVYNPLTPFEGEAVLNHFGDQFIELWHEWLEYKWKQHRFKYKTAKTHQTALDKFYRDTGGDLEVARETIATAMASGWKGLFVKTNSNNGTKQSTEAEELRKLDEYYDS